jgi:hypothetical protein
MKNRFDWLFWINVIALPLNILISVVAGDYLEAVAWFVALVWFVGYIHIKNNS